MESIGLLLFHYSLSLCLLWTLLNFWACQIKSTAVMKRLCYMTIIYICIYIYILFLLIKKKCAENAIGRDITGLLYLMP